MKAKKVHPITQRRRVLGLSGYALAKKAGISPGHLFRIESGELTSPRVDLAFRLADALGADVRQLFRSAA